jgi:hypothetical protein
MFEERRDPEKKRDREIKTKPFEKFASRGFVESPSQD